MYIYSQHKPKKVHIVGTSLVLSFLLSSPICIILFIYFYLYFLLTFILFSHGFLSNTCLDIHKANNSGKLYILLHIYLFFCLGFLSQTFTNHRTAGEGGEHFFNSSLLLPPASQTLRHQLGDCCSELTFAHSQHC